MKQIMLIATLLFSTMAFAQPETAIDSARIVAVSPDFDKAAVVVTVDSAVGDFFQVEVSFEGHPVASGTTTGGTPLELAMPEGFLRWTPDHPFLYDLKISVLKDGAAIGTAETQFAMRCFGTCRDDNGFSRFALNHLPLFLFGTEWTARQDSIPSDDALALEMQKIKDLGFNMVRVCGDADVERLRHHCDRIGLILWHDETNDVAQFVKQVSHIKLGGPFDEADMDKLTETYVRQANSLYNMAFKGVSAVVFGQFADGVSDCNGMLRSDRSTMKMDEGRLFRVNRKISHAFAE